MDMGTRKTSPILDARYFQQRENQKGVLGRHIQLMYVCMGMYVRRRVAS